MRKKSLFTAGILILAVLAAGCGTKSGNASESDSVRLQDDYYEYVNHDLLEKKEIPGDSGSWSYFYELQQNTYEALDGILKDAVDKRDQYEAGSVQQKISDLYLTAMDLKGREASGFGALKPYLDRVQNADSIEEYMGAMAVLSDDLGFGSLFPIIYSEDMEDSQRYACYLNGADLVLGKATLEDKTQTEFLGKYTDYIKTTLGFAGLSEKEAGAAAEKVLVFQQELAESALSLADQGNPECIYNPMSMEELQGLFYNVDMKRFLEEAGAGGWDHYIVMDPGVSKKINEYLTEEKLPLLKHYSTFCLINDFGPYLSPEIRDANMAWQNAWNGVREAKTDEKLASELTQNTLGFEFGRLYVEHYFSEKDKQAIEKMTHQILKQYKSRIEALDWMGEVTKARAVKKLEAVTLKIGYPDEWPDYYADAAVTSPEDGGILIDNMLSLLKSKRHFEAEEVGKPVDKGAWVMTPQTVNAYYNPSNNEIVFPAAILQPPYYDPAADEAVNLGGIGMVIAHEISHAFDSSGALYDENGNYNMWWTEEDMAEFEGLAQNVVDYYNRQEGFEGLFVNGEQTLNENIADLGSLACVTSIVGDDPEGLKQLFGQYAAIWASKFTDESMKKRLNTDVHSPSKVRVNAVISSTDAFYQAYPEIKEGDGMYVAPEKRVKVW